MPWLKTNDDRRAIRGSQRATWPDSIRRGRAAPDEYLRVTVYVRPKSRPPDDSAFSNSLPSARKYLSLEKFAQRYGADPADLEKVRDFAANAGLTVEEMRPDRRTVVLSGTVAALSRAFSVELFEYDHPEGAFRGRVGPLLVPAHLADLVEGVFGLDNRRAARPSFQPVPPDAGTFGPDNIPPGTFWPKELAAIYDFPNFDGSGEAIGILCLNDFGGGYDADTLAHYFQSQNLPVPSVQDIVVDGKGNTPDGSDVSTEAMLDLEIAASLAPRANIRVYFGSYFEQGWLNMFSHIATEKNPPSVVSISYGNPETAPTGWTRSGICQADKILNTARSRGITFCAASGDAGSSDALTPDGTVLLPGTRVHFPASSPYVLGCGGTQLVASGTQIASEVVWNNLINPDPSDPAFHPSGTGGGISDIFDLPDWQKNIPFLQTPPNSHFRGRGVPDVSANADPRTGYAILIPVYGANGNKQGTKLIRLGGTSAATPLWAACIARLNQALRAHAGHLNPLLYMRVAPRGFHDITVGNNGAYSAASGWDACTGLGTPDGNAVLTALSGNQSKSTSSPAEG